MFHDYDINEFVSIHPHNLLPQDIEPYIRRFKELFGQTEYDKFVYSRLPRKAEKWLEARCKCGHRMYSFMQRLLENPLELSSDTPSEESGSDASGPSGSGNMEEGGAAGRPPLPPPLERPPPPRSPSPRLPRSPSPQRQNGPMLSTGHSPPPGPYHMGFEQILHRRKCPTSPIITGPSGRSMAMIPVLPGNDAGIGSDSESSDTDTSSPEPQLPNPEVLEDLRLSPGPSMESPQNESDDHQGPSRKKANH